VAARRLRLPRQGECRLTPDLPGRWSAWRPLGWDLRLVLCPPRRHLEWVVRRSVVALLPVLRKQVLARLPAWPERWRSTWALAADSADLLPVADSADLLPVDSAGLLPAADSVDLLPAVPVDSAGLLPVADSVDLLPAVPVDSAIPIRATAHRKVVVAMVHLRWAGRPATVNRLPAVDSAEHPEVLPAISSPVVRRPVRWEWVGPLAQ